MRYNLLHRNMSARPPSMHPRLTDLQEHPLRQRLNNEFHARPPIPLLGAVLVSHLVFKHSTEKGRPPAPISPSCAGRTCAPPSTAPIRT